MQFNFFDTSSLPKSGSIDNDYSSFPIELQTNRLSFLTLLTWLFVLDKFSMCGSTTLILLLPRTGRLTQNQYSLIE